MDPAADSPDASAPRRRRSLGRFAILAMLLMLATLLVGGGTLLMRFRDTTPELTDAALEAAVGRWEANRPASYNIDLTIGGAQPGEIHLEVRDGQVTAFTRDGLAPKLRHTWDVWTVTGQFDMIYREQDLAADPSREMGVPRDTRLLLRAEFHPRWGYPVRYRRLVLGRGPEISWEVTHFEAIQ